MKRRGRAAILEYGRRVPHDIIDMIEIYLTKCPKGEDVAERKSGERWQYREDSVQNVGQIVDR
jgi:hypothetical protein